jgi:hypothetical protein
MIQPTLHRSFLGLAGVLCVLTTLSVARAGLIVTPTVTPVGVSFHYDYTITNDPPAPGEDVVIVDINVLPMDATLTNFFAPLGFQTVYDAGLGKVSFLPDVGSPDLFGVGTSISGFGFDSAHAPAPSTFDALTLLGNPVSGPTQAPIGAVIPEPGTITLLLVGLGALATIKAVQKRKRSD